MNVCRFKYKLVNQESGSDGGYKLIPEADLPAATDGEKVFSLQQARHTVPKFI